MPGCIEVQGYRFWESSGKPMGQCNYDDVVGVEMPSQKEKQKNESQQEDDVDIIIVHRFCRISNKTFSINKKPSA